MMEHHADGELLPSETLPRLQLGRCQHCHDGLMFPDSYDPADVRTCSACGRNDFRPSAEALADAGQSRPSCNPSHIHGRPYAVAGRGREVALPQGFVSLGSRRFT